MSARETAVSVWRRAVSLILLPSRVIEESVHAAVCWPWADALFVWVTPEDGSAGVEATGDLPDRVRWTAARAPTIVGLASFAAFVAVWVVGFRPANPSQWTAVSLAALWMGRVMLPSAGDDAAAARASAGGGDDD